MEEEKNGEEGFVIGFKEKSLYETKEIKSFEENSFLDEEKIKLAKWISKRYFCNLSDSIKLMLPPGTKAKNTENRIKEKTNNFVYLKKDEDEIEFEIEEGKIKSEKQIRILRFLMENDAITISDLEIFTETSRAIIKTLETCKNFNIYNKLDEIKNKTLILYGEDEEIISYNNIKELEKIPNSKIYSFPNTKHNVLIKRNFNEAKNIIINFLKN